MVRSIKGKPDPEIFLTAANKMNVKPHECLVIEDATNGVKAAKSAGMKSLVLKTLIQETKIYPKQI